MAVQKILISNREKLLRFLPSFLEDRTEDEQFIDEKSFLIRQIEQLGPAPYAPPAVAWARCQCRHFLCTFLFAFPGVDWILPLFQGWLFIWHGPSGDGVAGVRIIGVTIDLTCSAKEVWLGHFKVWVLSIDIVQRSHHSLNTTLEMKWVSSTLTD